MQSSRLPVELCERVIDFIWESPFQQRWTTVHNQRETLLSYTLVCTRLVPRARTYLYRTVDLQTSHKAELFARTLRNAPYLSTLVHELIITKDREYIPFAQGLFLRYLSNVHLLYLNVDWSRYPPQYRGLIQQFNICELCLRDELTAEDLCLIWALPQLQYCDIWADMSEFQREKTLALMRRRKGTTFCPALTYLVLGVDPQYPKLPIPCGALGNSMKTLHLHWEEVGTITDSDVYTLLSDFICGCTSLQRVSCSAAAYSMSEYNPLSRLLFLLRAVAEPALINTAAIDLVLMPYGIVELNTLDQHMTSLRDELITTLAQFSSLTSFEVNIYLRTHAWVSEKAYREMLLRHIPMLNGKLDVQVFRRVDRPFTVGDISPEPISDRRRHALRRNSISSGTELFREGYADVYDMGGIRRILTKCQRKKYRRVVKNFAEEKSRRKRALKAKKRHRAPETPSPDRSTLLAIPRSRRRRKSCCAALGVHMAARAQRNATTSSETASTSKGDRNGIVSAPEMP